MAIRGPDGFGRAVLFKYKKEDAAMKKHRRGPVATPGLDVLGPLEETIRQLRNGILTGTHVQALNEHRNPFTVCERARPATEPASPVVSVSLEEALAILGEPKVLSAAAVATAWGREAPAATPLRFTAERLREHARSNAAGETDWRVAYALGIPLREQYQIIGTDRNRQLCFYPGNDWWLAPAEDEWVIFRPEGRYYLLDLKGRYGRTSWHQQDEEIAKLGPRLRRSHEAVISEVAFLTFKTTGERLLPNWYHWGSSRSSLGSRVVVGFFGTQGWFVDSFHPVWDDHVDLRVCLEEVPA